jgi:hydroxyacylglutathione hydrolase
MLVKSEDQAIRIRRQLALIGIDLVGWGKVDLIDELKRTEALPLIDSQALAARLAVNGPTLAPRVIDVRGRSEWNHGHLPRATHIYLGDLVEKTVELNREEPLVIHCESGTRSSIAASLLLARGFSNVTNFAGGVDAWRKAGLPLIDDRE